MGQHDEVGYALRCRFVIPAEIAVRALLRSAIAV